MLQNSKNFQEDVKKYQSSIDRLINEVDKLEAKRLLNDLIYAVKNMDSMFIDMIYSKQVTSMGNEMREKINSIRQELDKKIKISEKTDYSKK